MSAQVIDHTSQTTTAPPLTVTDRPGRLGQAWRRVRQTVHEMNYASRRIAELNAALDR
ncbi:MAG TPA: hypothetical protein VHY58_00765 [Streptosporangiaceae bacterium]|jgi:hypothetical protein|nr:hypothetical protein [Streptosporangiaceae bacterium]